MASDFSIFFNATQFALGRIRHPKRVILDSIEIDCTVSESHNFDALITEFEVESGFDITDHRMIKPVEFSMTGIISDTPIDLDIVREAAELGAGLIAKTGLINNNQASVLVQTVTDARRAINNLISGDAVITKQAFNKLIQLYEVGTAQSRVDQLVTGPPSGVFTIVTKYRTYDNMVVKSLHFPRDRNTGDALAFTATFREIRIVETQVTEFMTPALQLPKPLSGLGGDDPGKPLIDDSSIIWSGWDGVSPGAPGGMRDRLEKELGKPLTSGSSGFPDMGNIGVFPVAPPPVRGK